MTNKPVSPCVGCALFKTCKIDCEARKQYEAKLKKIENGDNVPKRLKRNQKYWGKIK